MRLHWKRWLLFLSLLMLLLLARPALHLLRSAWGDKNDMEPVSQGCADDASRMNSTPAQVVRLEAGLDRGETALRGLLREAQNSGLKVAIAGARHSMGGQTIAPGGLVIDLQDLKNMRLDKKKRILTVGAGARWSEVIPFLDRHALSVEVMQSDNSFSVGGSLSVNCHGWQFNRPPIASTVEAMTLMTADGRLLRCSRQENRELFTLVLGGYGLFGVILEADLRVVPNRRLRLEQYVVPIGQALASFEDRFESHPEISMVYARLNLTPKKMFEEVIVSVFYPEDGPLPELVHPEASKLRRLVFRGAAGSDYGKELRWTAEKELVPMMNGQIFSRNQLLNDSVDWYLNRSAASCDILHEYFVPQKEVEAFLAELRPVIEKHHGDLLNVTVRQVAPDGDSFLRYADQTMVAFVMFFTQSRDAAGDAAMQAMTQEMIEVSLAHHGRYYLPYRLHAPPEQFRRAYPRSGRFFELKNHYDPGELFQNQFYLKYGRSTRAE